MNYTGCLIKLVLVCCIFISQLSYSDNSKSSEFSFNRIDDPKLKSIGDIFASVQDQQGFMWFGGANGLARYNGSSTKVFRHDPLEPHSLSDSYVNDLIVDYQGRLFIATARGLNRYNAMTDTFVRYLHKPDDPTSISHDTISSLYEREDSSMWVTTDGGGLNLFDPINNSFTHYQHDPNSDNSLSSNRLRCVYEDHQGLVWIGSEDTGLDQFNPQTGEFNHFSHDPMDTASLSHNNVFTLYEDSKRRLWIGTSGGGLNRLNRNTSEFVRYTHEPQDDHSLANDTVWNIAELKDGRLWVVTDNGGLNLLSPITGSFEHYKHINNDPSSLFNNKVRTAYRDKRGDWWFGHFPSGVSIINPYSSAFRNYYHEPDNENSLTDNGILSIVEDKYSNLWVGTEGGLNYFNRDTGTFTRYHHDPKKPSSLPAPAILSLFIDNEDTLWVGTWGGGLSQFNAETNSFIHHQSSITNPNSISGDRVWSIYEDKQFNLWLGTEHGGLNRYNRKTKRFTTFLSTSSSDTITSGEVVALYEDSHRDFWVGTFDGLNLMNRDAGTFTRYQVKEGSASSLNNNRIWSITEDSKAQLWIGTDGGLHKLDRDTGRFTAYQFKDSLPHDAVRGMIEDNDGALWLSTEYGLSRFELRTKTFRNYTKKHGLPGNLFNRPAYVKTSSGELVFGSTEGMTIFDPANIFVDKLPPSVILTDFQLFNQPVEIAGLGSPLQQTINYTEELTLRHEQSVFSLTFSALNYRISEMNQYAYLLEGFESKWNYVGNKRTATYTNLDPGSYVFRVKAANSDGVWNEQGSSLKITVLPPPWTTWWAYALYGTFFLCLIFSFIHAQRKKVAFERNVNAQLEHKVVERTAELKEKNREILATQKQLIQSSKMASIGTMTAGVAHEINNPTNFTHAAVYMMQAEISEIQKFLKQLAGGDNAEPEVLQSFDDKFLKLIELTKTATEGTTRIKSIVEDLRTYTRLDDAKQEKVQVTDLINSTVHLVQTQYDSVSIEAQFDYQPLFLCFPSKLNQVFMNIIVNACQAIENKKICEGLIIIKTARKDNQLILSFEDNGCGMSEQTINRIFEPFFTTKDVGSGTGLGMAISFGIIEDHNGYIEIDSEVDKGTKIIISFDI